MVALNNQIDSEPYQDTSPVAIRRREEILAKTTLYVVFRSAGEAIQEGGVGECKQGHVPSDQEDQVVRVETVWAMIHICLKLKKGLISLKSSLDT